jgi:spore maturation protein CgeB
MRILYVALAHEYGRPEMGPSFEEMNFRSALEGMGHELHAFDFRARLDAVGIERMARELVQLAARVEPDLAFFFLFEDEIEPATIRAVGQAGGCPTMNWFADDHWRFESFTSRYAPAFTWSVTTDRDALPKYRAIGYEGAILSQWGVNRYAYGRTATAIEHEVTFVGLPHGDRRAVVERLRRAGHDVQCWGEGWPNGRIEHAAMVHLFGASAINLNLTNSSTLPRTLRFRLGALARGRWADARQSRPRPPQIKGRTFEVPGSGGFLLTEAAPRLEEFFVPDREVGVFTDAADLVEQVDRWLANPEERAAVAEAGYRRALSEHTYDHRFAAIFAAAGLAERRG